MVVLDGMLTSTDKTSYLAGLARQGHYHARIAGCVRISINALVSCVQLYAEMLAD